MSLLGYDTFSRNPVVHSWGTATNGVAWQVVRGSNSNYAVTADEGTISTTSAETAQCVGTNATISANARVTARMSRATSTVSSTASLARATIVSGSITGYKVRLKSGNLDLVSEINGTATVIATTPYVVTTDSYDETDLLLIGNQLWANAWPDGTDEPSTWMIGPITDNSITGSGRCGLSATLQPGDTASFDTFVWDNLLPPNAPLPDTAYGYTLLNKNPIPLDTLQDTIAEGFTWLRPQTNWYPFIEPTDDGSRGSVVSSLLNWSLTDDIVAKCNSLGLNLCMVVQNPPDWHCSFVTSPANPHNPIAIPLVADTVAFVTAMVTRYNGVTLNPITHNPYGTIQCLMFNEDWDSFAAGWPGNGNPLYIGRDFTPLAPILQAIYPIIKAQLPNCLVGCASLLGKRTDSAHIYSMVSGLFAAWGAGHVYCDFLDMHDYNCSAPPTAVNPNLGDSPPNDRIAAMRAATAFHGFPEMDIRIMELGYQQGSIPPEICDVTQSQQATLLVQAVQEAFSQQVSHVCVWTIGSKDNNSLVQGHGSKKFYTPAYYALQTLASQTPVMPQANAAQQVAIVRSGNSSATVRNGAMQAIVRDGDVQALVRDGVQQAIVRDGVQSVQWREQ